MKLSRVCMRNPVGTSLLMLTLTVLGFIALIGLPIAYWPVVTPPFLVIQAPYPGVSPEDMEEEVTKVIEQAVSTIDHVYEIESSSMEGISQVIVRMDWGTDVTEAKNQVREKLDGARNRLPRDLMPISVFSLDAMLPPPLEIAVSSDQLDQGDVRKLLEDKIVSRLLTLPDVAAVDLRGGSKKIVRVSLDLDRILDLNISPETVVREVGTENVNLPAGELTVGSGKFLIRTLNRYESLDDIRDIVITRKGLTPVRLRDIATVGMVEDARNTGIARFNGKRALVMSVRQLSGGNTVKLVDETLFALNNIQKDYPKLRFQVIKDDSQFIRSSISSVTTNVLRGAIVAIIVIFLFLGTMRNTLVVALSIPVSVFATFLVMKSLGITLNTISLGGLALGVGLIVDASIVVLENIYYRLSNGDDTGESRLDIADNAVSEVGLAITASVLTSIVVFLPLAFTRGIAHFLLGELALTVVAALVFSLIVSLTLVPMLSYKLMRIKKTRFFLPRWWEGLMNLLIRIYRPLLALTSRTPLRAIITLVIVTVLMAVPVLLVRYLDVEQFPVIDQSEVRIDLELPPGTTLEATSNIAEDVERRLLALPEVEKVYSVVGLSAFYNQSVSNIAFMDATLRRSKDHVSTSDLLPKLRKAIGAYPDTKIRVRILSITEGMISEPIDLRVTGPDLDTLKVLAQTIEDSVRSWPFSLNVENNLKAGTPEIRVRVDREKASEWGLTASRVASLVRIAVDGQAVTRYSTGEGELYDVEVRLNPSAVRTPSDLYRLPLETPSGTVIPLEAVASFDRSPGAGDVRRADQERFLKVTAGITENIKDITARQAVERLKSEIKLPPDYSWKEAGVSRSISESFRTLGIALMIAIFLVYVVMATQFNNLWQPLVIATAIPMSVFGAVIGLIVFGGAININSFLGFIMLTGIVVNNGILLMDMINRGRRIEGKDRFQAITDAGTRRLRPILMTTLTTMAGMLFIALGLGEGGETLIPLSAVVIGGLASSTALTLIIVPVIYTLFDAVFTMFRRKTA